MRILLVEDGTIHLHSRPNAGTTFVVRLPASQRRGTRIVPKKHDQTVTFRSGCGNLQSLGSSHEQPDNDRVASVGLRVIFS